MNLEIGMYVRTINGKIWIITSQKAISGHRKDIINASYNIIDLIEVGDYVNGFEVLRIDDECNLYPKTLKCQYTNNTDYFDIFNENIRSVLTKEQFKSVEYKVKE